LVNAAKPICSSAGDPASQALANVTALANSIASMKTVITEVTNLVLKIQKSSNGNSSSNSNESDQDNDSTTYEDDGLEEEPYANLNVTRNSEGKYKLQVKSNIAEDQLICTATKKGFKAITYRVTTNEFGSASIITSRKLSGFTITVRYSGEFLTSTRVK